MTRLELIAARAVVVRALWRRLLWRAYADVAANLDILPPEPVIEGAHDPIFNVPVEIVEEPASIERRQKTYDRTLQDRVRAALTSRPVTVLEIVAAVGASRQRSVRGVLERIGAAHDGGLPRRYFASGHVPQ